MLVGTLQMGNRPEYWCPDGIEHLILLAPLVALNCVVHQRLLTNRSVTRRWMLVLSAMDIAVITGNAVVEGSFDNYFFLGCFPALVGCAVVFSPSWHGRP